MENLPILWNSQFLQRYIQRKKPTFIDQIIDMQFSPKNLHYVKNSSIAFIYNR